MTPHTFERQGCCKHLRVLIKPSGSVRACYCWCLHSCTHRFCVIPHRPVSGYRFAFLHGSESEVHATLQPRNDFTPESGSNVHGTNYCSSCRHTVEVMQACMRHLRHMRPLLQHKLIHDVLSMSVICICLGGLPHLIEPDV